MRLKSVRDPSLADFDAIIDVRSPLEFAEDHLPGAINLPVLSDEERAQVGTIYKQISPFDARKFGGALVAANAARHISTALADKPGGWRPLVYCWRGGQRSGAFATILAQIGWRVDRIEGGYKSWRSLVVERVQQGPMPPRVIVIDGNTGSGKTEILQRLAAQGHQVIDLEGLAQHRGSLFGAVAGGQPTQKMFEGRLALALEACDPARPVLVEAESARIGRLSLPRAVWQAICAAPRLRLEVPLAERVGFILRSYGDISRDPARLAHIIDQLAPFHPRDRIALWQDQARRGDWAGLVAGLMRDHYDPRYERHRARHDSGTGPVVVRIESLADPEAAARQLSRQLAAALPG